MKNYSIVFIILSSLLTFCFPSFASHWQDGEEILYSTNFSAEKLKDVIACDARTNPLLYYIPVDEMHCEIPIGYGIDFEGSVERESEEKVSQTENRWTLFAIPVSWAI